MAMRILGLTVLMCLMLSPTTGGSNYLSAPFESSLSEQERYLITTVNDDVNEGRVKVSVCKNAVFQLCPINPGQTVVHLNETVSCLLEMAQEFDDESTCAMVFNSITNNIIEVCGANSKLCSDVVEIPGLRYYMKPLAPITCYAQNYFKETSDCRYRLDQLMSNVIPCVAEAAKYCADVSSADKMICLSETLIDNIENDYTESCKTLIGIYNADVLAAADAAENIDDDGTDDGAENMKSRSNVFYADDQDTSSKILKGKNKNADLTNVSSN